MLYSHHWTSVYMRETLYLAVCPVFSFKNVVPDLLGTHRGATCLCLQALGLKVCITQGSFYPLLSSYFFLSYCATCGAYLSFSNWH